MSSAEAAKADGNAAWNAGDNDNAIKHFTRAIEIAEAEEEGSGLESNLHIYYSNRSAAYTKRGAFPAALLDAEKCVKLKPTFAKGWGRKGAALLGLRRYKDAVDTYVEGIRLDPSNQELKRGLDGASRSFQTHSTGASGGMAQPSHSAAGQGLATLSIFLRKNKGLTVLFLLRTLIIGAFMLFMVPFLGGGVVFYKRALGANLALILTSIYINHGKPRFNLEYGIKLLEDSNVQGFYSSLLLYFQRPYLVGVAPVVITNLVQWLWFFSCVLQVSAPSMLAYLDGFIEPWSLRAFGIRSWRSLNMNSRWLKAKKSTAVFAAQLEVIFGIMLVVEILLPRRNIIMMLLWWQMLRMKCMLENVYRGLGNTPYLCNAFKSVDDYILVYANHPRCPSLVRTGYDKLRGIRTCHQNHHHI